MAVAIDSRQPYGILAQVHRQDTGSRPPRTRSYLAACKMQAANQGLSPSSLRNRVRYYSRYYWTCRLYMQRRLAASVIYVQCVRGGGGEAGAETTVMDGGMHLQTARQERRASCNCHAPLIASLTNAVYLLTILKSEVTSGKPMSRTTLGIHYTFSQCLVTDECPEPQNQPCSPALSGSRGDRCPSGNED